ncbi:hypothetical protein C0992_011712 [Termitomyces sp. T32_za158]|nr:hypothetical protein C0992_011712 [Termitomyces sp. T32_za158]
MPSTAPHAKPFPKAHPYVAITTLPPHISPPNPFANLKRSVKRDANNTIIAVIGYLLFASAQFANQANFTRISKQKSLVEALSTTLPIINCHVGDDAPDIKAFQIKTDRHEVQHRHKLEEHQYHQRVEQDVNMADLSPVKPIKRKANVSIAHCFVILSERLDLLTLAVLSSLQAEFASKPCSKKIKINPAAAIHKPGSNAMLALLSQVDSVLDTAKLADDATAARNDLEKHRKAVNLAVQQQLYHLDIFLQTFHLLSECLACLTQALGPFAVEETGSLLQALQVSTEIPDKDSDSEFQDPHPEDSEDAIELQVVSML